MRVLMNQPAYGCLRHFAFFSNDWEIKQFFHDLNSIKIHEDKLWSMMISSRKTKPIITAVIISVISNAKLNWRKMKLKRFIRSGEKIWSDNPIAQLLIYAPASIIASILSVPMILLAIPSTIFGHRVERKWTTILLTIQHSISLSFWYFVADFIFPSIVPLHPVVNCFAIITLTYFNFQITIKSLTDETLQKVYGEKL
jgi:hypothetical protein